MRNTLDTQHIASFQDVDSAYIIGAALGDGNLSRPNGRAIRLRITCDSCYPGIAAEIIAALQRLFPKNKVSIARRKKDTCFDVSVYSNKIEFVLPWKVGAGTKYAQCVRIPSWIFKQKATVATCLKGLLQTDGSIYVDRGYLMVNFTNNVIGLAKDVEVMTKIMGYDPHLYTTSQKSGLPKYTVRLSKNTRNFLEEVHLTKI